MAGSIYEFFGYRAVDNSPEARAAADNRVCPFLQTQCIKTLNDGAIAGVCAIKPITSDPVICCPIRLYADHYRILLKIAILAFGVPASLVPGMQARFAAANEGTEVIAVFGKGWGGELRLPKKGGSGNYFVDWILARISSSGELQEFVAVEVQTMDTTGNYRNGRSELLEGRRGVVNTSVGINWENVSKRIIPQLIYKGRTA